MVVLTNCGFFTEVTEQRNGAVKKELKTKVRLKKSY